MRQYMQKSPSALSTILKEPSPGTIVISMKSRLPSRIHSGQTPLLLPEQLSGSYLYIFKNDAQTQYRFLCIVITIKDKKATF